MAVMAIGLMNLWLTNLFQRLNDLKAAETVPMDDLKKVFEDIPKTEISETLEELSNIETPQELLEGTELDENN